MLSLPVLATDEMAGFMVLRKLSFYPQTNTYFRPRLSIYYSFFFLDSNWQKGTIIIKWLHISSQVIIGLSFSKSKEM